MKLTVCIFWNSFKQQQQKRERKEMKTGTRLTSESLKSATCKDTTEIKDCAFQKLTRQLDVCDAALLTQMDEQKSGYVHTIPKYKNVADKDILEFVKNYYADLPNLEVTVRFGSHFNTLSFVWYL